MAPDDILEIGFAFRKSRVLFSAVELGVFTVLAEGALASGPLAVRLGIHERGARDFLDALVSVGLLERNDAGQYANAPTAAIYLDARQPSYLGGLFGYLNERMYPAWAKLTPALRTGAPQAGPWAAGGFSSFYSDEAMAETFFRGMTGASVLVGSALAAHFAWSEHRTFADIGTAQGGIAVEVARAHPHLRGIGFDLPSVEGAFSSYVRASGVQERVSFQAGDFFKDPFPRVDVLILGRVLHDWDVPTRRMLLAKAHAALPRDGTLIVHDALIDDDRRGRPQSMLSSLNMLIQTAGGSEYTAAECSGWMRAAGFTGTRVVPLAAMQAAVIATKA